MTEEVNVIKHNGFTMFRNTVAGIEDATGNIVTVGSLLTNSGTRMRDMSEQTQAEVERNAQLSDGLATLLNAVRSYLFSEDANEDDLLSAYNEVSEVFAPGTNVELSDEVEAVFRQDSDDTQAGTFDPNKSFNPTYFLANLKTKQLFATEDDRIAVRMHHSGEWLVIDSSVYKVYKNQPNWSVLDTEPELK